jgi:hypothetical protein
VPKRIREPAYKDCFEDGYEHALKDAHDRLASQGLHDAAISIGEMQGKYSASIAKIVRGLEREWKAEQKARKRG